MSYELKENDVLRDGVKIATVVNGEIVMEEGYEQYRMAAGNFIRQDSKIARLRDGGVGEVFFSCFRKKVDFQRSSIC